MKYDFLVVLNSDCFERDHERLWKALQNVNDTRWLIICGNTRTYNVSGWMKDFLITHKVESQKIIKEEKAINTVTQMFRLLPVKDKKIAVISHQDHLEWVEWICKDMGLKVDLIPC